MSGLRTVGSLDEGHFGQLVVTLGISLILQNGGQILFGSTPVAVRTPLSSQAFQIGPLYDDATVFLNKAKLVAFFVAVLAAVVLYLVLEYTRLGKALRAAADNPTAATYMGIDVDRSYRIAFGLGCGITAVAGGLMATYISFGPFVGFDYVIIMYSGVVLGGMGSIFGRLLGRGDGGLRAAVLGADPAAAAAERGDLRRVPADRAAAAAGPVRPLGGAGMRQGAGPHLRRHLIVLAVVSVVYLLITLFVTNSYYQLILTLVPIWALFGVSWNILSGYGGQLSFGHASFFGIGAYTVTLTIVYWGLSPWLGIPLGGILGGVAAILIGIPHVSPARALLRPVDAGLSARHPLRDAVSGLPGSLDPHAPRERGWPSWSSASRASTR